MRPQPHDQRIHRRRCLTPEPLFTRRRIIVLAVCVGIFALGQFHRASGAVFSPILMARFDASAATIGGLVSAMFLATVIAQAPFGVLLDRFGPRYVIAGCLSMIAAGAALFALGETFEALLASRIMIGIGAASMGAATHVIIARTFPARDFGYISGLVVTIGGVGGLLGSYPLSVALERLPWALVFGAVAAVTVGLTIAILTAIRGEGPAPRPAEGAPTGGYLTLLRSAEFLKILAMAIVTWAPITAISGLWGGPYLQDALGLAPEPAGAVLSLMFVMTLSGGYVFGVLDRRMTSRRLLIFAGSGLSMGSLFLLAALPAPQPAIAIGLLLAMMFSQQFYIPLAAHMRKVSPDHILGRASTLMTLVAVAAIPTMQAAIGALLDLAAAAGLGVTDQYRVVWAAMGGLILICGAIYASARYVNETQT